MKFQEALENSNKPQKSEKIVGKILPVPKIRTKNQVFAQAEISSKNHLKNVTNIWKQTVLKF